MSDDERKKKANEQDENAASAEESDEERDDEESSKASGDDDDEASSKASDDDDDASAKRVADALGVGDEEEEEPAAEKAEGEADEAAAAPNRAARRAEASQRRKKRKAATAAPSGEGADGADGEDVDEALPKDKNARAKALLKRRREQAETAAARPVQLLPGEMVDDALARSASAVGKWARTNFGAIQWVILAALVAGGGYALYVSQTEKKMAAASDALAVGVRADRGRVIPDDKRPDEEKEADPAKVFKTAEERADNALASYRKVAQDHAGSGAAILARLGEGNTLLDKRDWDKALEAFSTVSSSTLAGADPDVKSRALEGIGFAKEGKKDYDGATAAFKELQNVDGGKNFIKELGQYHEARMLLAKGDKEKAKELLKQIHTALEKPAEGNSNSFLKGASDEMLRRLDPTAVPAKPLIGGGGKGAAMSKEEMERAIKKMQENLQKKGKDSHDGEKH